MNQPPNELKPCKHGYELRNRCYICERNDHIARIAELEQQFSSSANQYQEACDDAHRFAMENENLRQQLADAELRIAVAVNWIEKDLRTESDPSSSPLLELLKMPIDQLNQFVEQHPEYSPEKP